MIVINEKNSFQKSVIGMIACQLCVYGGGSGGQGE